METTYKTFFKITRLMELLIFKGFVKLFHEFDLIEYYLKQFLIRMLTMLAVNTPKPSSDL